MVKSRILTVRVYPARPDLAFLDLEVACSGDCGYDSGMRTLDVGWETCAASPKCTGSARRPYGRCLAHLGRTELDEVVAGLSPGSAIDLRATVVGGDLLERILAATRGHLGRARFDWATFPESVRLAISPSRETSPSTMRISITSPRCLMPGLHAMSLSVRPGSIGSCPCTAPPSAGMPPSTRSPSTATPCSERRSSIGPRPSRTPTSMVSSPSTAPGSPGTRP